VEQYGAELMTQDVAAERLKDLLVEHLVAWAAMRWPDEPVYAFGLAFSAGWPPIPAPGLGTVATRDDVLEEPDEYGVGLLLWNPAEYDIYDADFIETGVPEEARQLAWALNDAWTEADDDSDELWFAFMGDLAKSLAAHDWGAFTTSDDFVVISNAPLSQTTESAIDAQLARSVPAHTLSNLRERGLLNRPGFVGGCCY
jgi:hypothetical protein